MERGHTWQIATLTTNGYDFPSGHASSTSSEHCVAVFVHVWQQIILYRKETGSECSRSVQSVSKMHGHWGHRHRRRHAKRSLMSWVGHTKRRMGRAHPSFGMTTTQTLWTFSRNIAHMVWGNLVLTFCKNLDLSQFLSIFNYLLSFRCDVYSL